MGDRSRNTAHPQHLQSKECEDVVCKTNFLSIVSQMSSSFCRFAKKDGGRRYSQYWAMIPLPGGHVSELRNLEESMLSRPHDVRPMVGWQVAYWAALVLSEKLSAPVIAFVFVRHNRLRFQERAHQSLSSQVSEPQNLRPLFSGACPGF